MNKKEKKIILARIEKWYSKLPNLFFQRQKKFSAKYGWSKKATSFNDRKKLQYKVIEEKQEWGKEWESAWFHLEGEIPSDWVGKDIYADLDFSGEGLVYDQSGSPLQGITNASIWDKNFARTRVPLFKNCSDVQKFNIWVEAAANSLFGVYLDPDPKKEDPKRFGWFEAKVERIRYGVFDTSLWSFYLDVRILLGILKRIDKKSVRYARILVSLNNCIDVFSNNRENVKEAKKCIVLELNKPASASDLEVSAIGHAHIDTGWLWPVRETIRKCARTFSTQLSIIDDYPNYIFGASQPQHYQFVKEHYPEIYSRIKEAVKKGQWELQGGMWVEADCNLISGESMVRQVLNGKNFFMDEFGVDVDNLWLPDVFGYSAALPQILKKSGIKYFLTQKLSWSQYNNFPHHSFNWRGIDGTEILTHFPPENTYNSELDSEFLIPAQNNFKEKGFLNEFISLFGVGDGGGGPKPENIELGNRMSSLENCPRVRFDTAKNFFDRLEKHKDKLETWVGELYLELHRGTLTTQGLVKKLNRKLEYKLTTVETLWSFLPLSDYPSDTLEMLWRKLLINQFHDIIPGSSINLVYQDTHREYEEIDIECDNLISFAKDLLFENKDDSFVLFNPLSYKWSGIIQIPDTYKNHFIEDIMGNSLVVDFNKRGNFCYVEIEPLSFTTFKKGKKFKPNKNDNRDQYVLENKLVRYEFNYNGQIISAYDKDVEKDILIKEGNIFTLYDDTPNNWDAWDIDFFYRNAKIETAKTMEFLGYYGGEMLKELTFKLSIGGSTIEQIISLGPGTKRLDFETRVDWKETHKMLRVHFPVNVFSERASFDIQYGYVRRNNHRNTSWDRAKFEVVGHKYADISSHDYGVALMNDCKYGYMVHDNILDLNLLRSPSNPDPDADIRQHEFIYSFYPHENDLIRSNVISESRLLNQKPILFDGVSSNIKSEIFLEGDGLELSVIKKAEKKDCWILRIVETHGRTSVGRLYLKGNLIESDLMEWNESSEKIKVSEFYPLSLNSFEIKTYMFFDE